MFEAKDFLDLKQFVFPELFEGDGEVWTALKRLPEFIKKNLKPARLGTTLGTPYIADDVFVGKGTVIENGATIKGPAIIGENCQIRSSAYIRGDVIVGNDCVLGNACEFKNAVLFNGAQVPHFSYVGDSILGYKAHLGAGTILSNVKSIKGNVMVKYGDNIDTGLRKFGSIIGDGCDIGCNCVLNPGSIIGRNSVLYPNVLWRGVCAADSIVKLRQQQEITVPEMKRALLILLTTTLAAVAQEQMKFPPQAFSLRPQKTEGGILFQCYAPDAHVVYLAGDFNGWANNVDGRITNAAFAMSGRDTNGMWRKTVKLDPGIYRFKFNINGEAKGWFAPDSIDELDGDKNAILHVDGGGDVLIHSAHNLKWKPQVTDHGILLQCYAPDAHIVYLAGDFNDWGHNRDGLVFDPQFAMIGPGRDGVWHAGVELKAGRHAYQFVIDGDHWIADPNADEKDDGGHSVVVVK